MQCPPELRKYLEAGDEWIIAGHQAMARSWWNERRDAFEIYISSLVVEEVSAGDALAARERLRVIEDLPLLDITPEATELASGILASGKIPRKAASDALHIATAAVHQMEFLVTWNCVHLANAVNAKALASICRANGCDCPVICTPEELMGELP